MTTLLLGLLFAIGATVGIAGAGERAAVSFTLRKVVVGTAPSGFTVVLTCSIPEVQPETATLQFDATGAPTTSDDPEFQIVDGAWMTTSIEQPGEEATCTATETVTAGASSTSWTCDYQFTTQNGVGIGGCDAPSGADAGPVGFTISPGAGILTQDVTVVFTNTFAAAAVETSPQFTG